MLEIWASLASELPEWQLEMLGDGIDADKVKEIARERKIPRVNFRGFTDPIPYFKKAPFLCMTSSNEGFPMVLLEASAFGCVPVAFDTSPVIREILCNGMSGYLIPPLNTNAYAQKLRALMRGENTVSPGSCKDNARRYSIESIGEKWMSLFEELAKINKK